MNRRGFLASVIAAVLAPKELIADSHFSNILRPGAGELSEASLEQMLIHLQTNHAGRALSIRPTRLMISSGWAKILRPSLEEYFHGQPSFLSGFSDSSLARAESFIGINSEIHLSHVRDGQSLFARRHPTLRSGNRRDWCSVCEGAGGQYADDEGSRFDECPECGV